MADVPGGIPEVLFHMPHAQGMLSLYTESSSVIIRQSIIIYCIKVLWTNSVDPNLLQEIPDVCQMPLMCSSSFKALADHLARTLNLAIPPLNVHQACQSYFAIVHFCIITFNHENGS